MTKIAPGLYREAHGGLRAFVRVEGQLRTKRFPEDTDPAEAQTWRKRERASKYLPKPEPEPDPEPAPPTLAADVRTYLGTVTAMAGYAERERHLLLWVAALGGEQPRSAIKPFTIQAVLHGWRKGGLAADTCNKRRTALMALWHRLDGRSAYNPVREVPRFRPPEPEPRGVAYAILRRIFKQMPDSATKIRLEVMAYTGLRPVQLRSLERRDWDKPGGRLTLPATGKGQGTRRETVSLLPEATAALQRFDREELWGKSFGSAPMALVWRRALKRAKVTTRIVPYDLRHSFGTAAYRASGDLRAVQTLLGHSSIRMTERYTLGAVEARQQAAIRAMGRQLPRGRVRR